MIEPPWDPSLPDLASVTNRPLRIEANKKENLYKGIPEESANEGGQHPGHRQKL